MPPRASSRLRLFLVPGPAGGPPAAEVLAGLAEIDWGVGADAVRAWSGAPRFFANAQGGFRVSCPTTGGSLVAGFPAALEAWRLGGPRQLACACGAVHDLDTLAYAPAAAFASTAIELWNVPDADLPPAAARALGGWWPGFRVVGSRG